MNQKNGDKGVARTSGLSEKTAGVIYSAFLIHRTKDLLTIGIGGVSNFGLIVYSAVLALPMLTLIKSLPFNGKTFWRTVMWTTGVAGLIALLIFSSNRYVPDADALNIVFGTVVACVYVVKKTMFPLIKRDFFIYVVS